MDGTQNKTDFVEQLAPTRKRAGTSHSTRKLPNLASRILGMCLRWLSRDWLSRWDQPVLAVESFVDQIRFEGTCYRACGFEEVGLSAGFARDHRDFYHEHGRPKQLFIRELDKKARRRHTNY